MVLGVHYLLKFGGVPIGIIQNGMAYGSFKDLSRETTSDKVLRHKAFNIAKSPNYDGYSRGIISMFYKFFNKNSAGANTSSGAIKSKILLNQQLAEELHKRIIKKCEKRKVYSSFKDLVCRLSRYTINK